MSSTRNTYIAVIDDDESMCRSLGRLLRTAGLQPITYPSAEAFLGDLKHPQFDCLVLDIELTGMSGIDLNRQLAGIGSAIPVIFITSHDDPEIREQALASGCAGLFRKTVAGSELLNAVHRAIASADNTLADNRLTPPKQERTTP
jgi:FixJ family two-component response regulator